MAQISPHNLILARLGKSDILRLRQSAKVADRLEREFNEAVQSAIAESIEETIRNLPHNGKISVPDFETIFIEQSFRVSIQAMKLAQTQWEVHENPRLAAKPMLIPRSLKDLMDLYDRWKKKKFVPKRPAAIAKKIEKHYLKRVQSVWKKYSEPFRQGDAYTQQQVIEKIRKAGQTTQSRAQTIVRTETTNYYNTARREYYDQSQDVTHYLFMAVRDNATTRWCTPKTVQGKRGRHGLVYKKGMAITDAETPGCHWNCRSELLPLSPLNPVHLKLIQDPSIQRMNVICFPLPKGWVAGTRKSA